MSNDDLRWAAQVLIRAISEQSPTHYADSSIYPYGADRSAAIGLPTLLATALEEANLDQQAIIDVLERCTTHHFDEVRVAFAQATERVWSAPCNIHPHTGMCRHEAVLHAVEAGLRDCRLGPWYSDTGLLSRPQLDGPYEETLPQIETEALYLTSIIPPLIAAASASHADNCITERARVLTDTLLDAHVRATDHWAREGYESRLSKHSARMLADLAIDGDTGPLRSHVGRIAANARALHGLLDDLARLFTYDDSLRASLTTVWSVTLETALDALGDGTTLRHDHHWGDYALGSLLPHPQIDAGDTDLDATFARTRRDWLHPDDITDLITRWIPIARHEPKAIDALTRLAKCAPLEWQRTTGLAWMEQLIDGAYSAAYRCWDLPDWLEAVYAPNDMQPEQLARWRRLVDGLAAAGDTRAVRLQQLEE